MSYTTPSGAVTGFEPAASSSSERPGSNWRPPGPEPGARPTALRSVRAGALPVRRPVRTPRAGRTLPRLTRQAATGRITDRAGLEPALPAGGDGGNRIRCGNACDTRPLLSCHPRTRPRPPPWFHWPAAVRPPHGKTRKHLLLRGLPGRYISFSQPPPGRAARTSCERAWQTRSVLTLWTYEATGDRHRRGSRVDDGR